MSIQTEPTSNPPAPGKLVRIHIDQKPYELPSPTTGAALYCLAHIKPDLRLYREVEGDREDRMIDDGPDALHEGTLSPGGEVMVKDGEVFSVSPTGQS